MDTKHVNPQVFETGHDLGHDLGPDGIVTDNSTSAVLSHPHTPGLKLWLDEHNAPCRPVHARDWSGEQRA
jgi:hypothetical protein